MIINIVNKKNHKEMPNDVYIGRPTALGNPYPVEIYGREKSIQLYQEEFQDCMMYAKDTQHFNYRECIRQVGLILSVHNKFKSVNLVCWCAPLACHGSVVAEFIHQMDFDDSDNLKIGESNDELQVNPDGTFIRGFGYIPASRVKR